jgi:hypothetical protein
MAVGLWKIAQHTAGIRIDLLGEQTYVVAAKQQSIE